MDLENDIGNPVFAIETNLSSLKRRIEALSGQEASDESFDICDEIQKSLEKIKEAIKSTEDERQCEFSPATLVSIVRIDDDESQHAPNCSRRLP